MGSLVDWGGCRCNFCCSGCRMLIVSPQVRPSTTQRRDRHEYNKAESPHYARVRRVVVREIVGTIEYRWEIPSTSSLVAVCQEVEEVEEEDTWSPAVLTYFLRAHLCVMWRDGYRSTTVYVSINKLQWISVVVLIFSRYELRGIRRTLAVRDLWE